MRTTFLFLLIIVTSCSNDDKKDQIVVPDITGNWELISITFNGNGVSGTGDPFFYGSHFNIKSIGGGGDFYRGVGKYPNGAGLSIDIFLRQDGNIWYKPIDDTGVKNSNPYTTYFNIESRLINTSGNDIFLDNSATPCVLTISGETFSVEFDKDGYIIKHTFKRS